MTTPILKWPGGKRRLAEKILDVLPKSRRLIEPLCGSCAVSLASGYSMHTLADANPDLINLYLCLREEGDDFIDYCESFFLAQCNTAEAYYAFRAIFNKTGDRRQTTEGRTVQLSLSSCIQWSGAL